MPLKRKIKTLVIDDSLVFREGLMRLLAADPDIEPIASAADVYAGRDLIERLNPDVLTLDVEMPRMNGIEFLRRLMPQHPLPVVVVSSAGQNVFDALREGAVDFVTKPAPGSGGLETFARELTLKIKIASVASVGRHRSRSASQAFTAGEAGTADSAETIGQPSAATRSCAADLILIGASTGGTEAIFKVLNAMPADSPPILIVQHMPPIFTRLYAERLDRSCAINVREAADGEPVMRGQALVAPGDRHLSVRRDGRRLVADCRPGERVNGHCPSVDVLFQSAVPLKHLSVTAALLTGMGHDGAKGLLDLKRAGAWTIGQDETTSVVYGMPKVAFEIGALCCQAPLDEIAGRILGGGKGPSQRRLGT